ncbi:hypothetical protein S40288_03940 [Stachybotrys chartarum IBT 40288]|nr:hypothetical protein S40288_03940 [Stachybotrys chartarum IBT 40288]
MTQPSPAPTAFAPPLLLTIRFTASIPDMELDITAPHATSVVSLKHLLRTRLDTRNRLRLIHQGRLLPDAAALSAVVKARAPQRSAEHARPAPPDAKGKAVAGQEPVSRIYVNCSIGDELSPEELDAERIAADKAPDGDADASAPDGQIRIPTSTRPRPRGFDRLLDSGFIASDVSTLRTQFISIQTGRLGRDIALLSPDSVRRLEDEWIDSNASDMPSMGLGGAAAGDGEMNGFADHLDGMVRGMLIGFLFPLGSLAWLVRQDILMPKFILWVVFGAGFSVLVAIVMGISGGDR